MFKRFCIKLNKFFHDLYLFKFKSNKKKFTSIWKTNYWNDSESLSGPGSNLSYTENIRKELPILFNKFEIKSIFDAPCGDFFWMKKVIYDSDIQYLGGDIVNELVFLNNQRFSSDNISFIEFDITIDKYPECDLWICRDVFFHLSNKDIFLALEKFSNSNIKYILTTTHFPSYSWKNSDINTGSFRLIDIFQKPFSFPSNNVLYRFDDYTEPHPPREMCLFSRNEIVDLVNKYNSK
jgi:hypothetical protein